MKRSGGRRMLRTLLALTLCALLLCAPLQALADGLMINGIGCRLLSQGSLIVSAVQHGYNSNLVTQPGEFYVTYEGIPLSAKQVTDVHRGFIFVVDISRYAVSSSARRTEGTAFQTILSGIVDNLMDSNDGARFILAEEHVNDVFGAFVSKSQAAQGVTFYKSAHDSYATSLQNDKVYMNDAILYGVQVAGVDTNYDVYHVIVLSEGTNSKGGQNTPVGTIVHEALSSSPCSIHVFTAKDIDANNATLRTGRENLYQMADKAGGVYFEVDVSDRAYGGNPVETQISGFIANLEQNLGHDMVLSCDLSGSLSAINRSSSHRSTVTVTRMGTTAVFEGILPMRRLPSAK